MQLGDEESLIVVINQYKMMLNKITSYSVSDEWVADKIKALIDLMPQCDLDVFVKVCEEWVKKEDSMPTPKQLSFKCLQFVNNIEKQQALKNPKVCYEIEFKKKKGLHLLEFEEEICKKYEPVAQYSNKYKNFVSICTFHIFMHKEQNGMYWNGYKGVFQFCKNKIMSYVDSEIFIHKYLKGDMNIKHRMLESLDDEHRAEVKIYENYYKDYREYGLGSSLASVFKEVEITESRNFITNLKR
jgi:hypothetical protein